MTGAELKTLREGLNLSAQELADLCGVKHDRTIRRWESDEREVPEDVSREVTRLNAWVDQLTASWADQIKTLPKTQTIHILRYETAEDFRRYNPGWPVKHAHRFHHAALGRLFRLGIHPGLRLVSMVSEAYEAWRFAEGLEDDQIARSRWAALQVPECRPV